MKKGFTLLREFTYGLDFGSFSDDNQEVITIHDSKEEAEAELKEYSDDVTDAVEMGHMEDNDYEDMSVSPVVETDTEYIAYDEAGNYICSQKKV